MKKSRVIAIFVSFCLVIGIVAGSIDWSFLGADAQVEESSEELAESVSEEVLSEETADEALSEEATAESHSEEEATDEETSEEVSDKEASEEIPDKEVTDEDLSPETEEPVSETSVKTFTFTYSDDTVSVTAVCSAESGIPEDAVLHADKLEENSDEYQDAYQALLKSMNPDEGETLVFAPYDVYFIAGDEKIEPVSGMVQITMEFTGPVLNSPEDKVLGDIFCVHIKEDGDVEELEAEVNGDSVSFAVDSFSIMGVAALSSEADDDTDTDNAYAILYSDGTMVFQRGNVPEEGHGDVVESYTGFENHIWNSPSDVLWNSKRDSITSIVFKDTIIPISLNYWFYGCSNLISLDLSNLDTSNITNMGQLFQNCSSLTSLDLSGFDTSKVTNMGQMFRSCSSLVSLNLSGFDTSKVTDMSYMFYHCNRLTSLDVSGFETSNVKDMRDMFYYCEKLISLDISGFNTSNVKYMLYMFYKCEKLISLDVSGFNTSKVTIMDGMFYNCSSLTLLDLSRFDTDNVTSMSYMLSGCNSLSHIIIREGFEFKNNHGFNGSDTWLQTGTDNVYTTDEIASGNMSGDFTKILRVRFIPVAPSQKGVQYWNYSFGSTAENLPDDPVADDREFIGWFTEKTGGEQLVEGSIIDRTQYYAQYNNRTYNVVLNPNGADGDDITITVPANEYYNLPGDAFSWEGFLLTGWNTKRDGSGKSYDPYGYLYAPIDSGTGTAALYAQWEKNDVITITFEGYRMSAENDWIEIYDPDMPVPEPVTVPKGKNLRIRDIPGFNNLSYDEYNLTYLITPNDYWFSMNQSIDGEFLTKDIMLKVLWSQNVTVTLDYSGYMNNVEINAPFDSPIKLPSCDNMDNVVFLGWYERGSESSWYPVYSNIVGAYPNAYYKAMYGYRPVFDVNGGTFIRKPAEYEASDEPIFTLDELPVAEKAGCTFEGWFFADGTQAQPGITVDLSEGYIITARWSDKKPMITVNFETDTGVSLYNGINSINTMSVSTEKGSPVSFPDGYVSIASPITVNRPGGTEKIYSDGRIYYEDENGVRLTSGASFDKDTTLIAKAEYPSVATLFCVGSDEDMYGNCIFISSSDSYRYFGVLSYPDEAAAASAPYCRKNGYTFMGWFTEPNGNGERFVPDNVDSFGKTYYAYYVPFVSDNSSYKYGAEWYNVSSNESTADGDNLIFHLSGGNVPNNVSALLHLRFELSEELAESGAVIPAGSVRIRVPGHIWDDADGNPADTNNIEANLMPYPQTASGMLFSYKKDGDDYIIINGKDISGPSGFEMTVSYSVDPSSLYGGGMFNNTFIDGYPYAETEVPVWFFVDADGDGNDEVSENRLFHAEMHTEGSVTHRLYKTNVKYNSNDIHVSNIHDYVCSEDDGSYFYIVWNTLSYTNMNGLTANYEILNVTGDGQVVGPSVISLKAVKNSSRDNYIVTKHPVSLLENAPATGIQISVDGITSCTTLSGYRTDKAFTMKTTVHKPEYPSGKYSKQWEDWNNRLIPGEKGSGQSNLVYKREELPVRYDIYYNTTSPNKPVYNDATGTYDVMPYMVEIESDRPGDMLYSTGSDPDIYVWEPTSGNVELDSNDYYIEHLSGDFVLTKVSNENGMLMPVESNIPVSYRLYIRRGNSNEYELYKTGFDTGVWTYFTDEGFTDVTGYKLELDCDEYAASVSLQETIVLKPSDKLRTLMLSDISKGATSIIKSAGSAKTYKVLKDGSKGDLYAWGKDNLGSTNPADRNIYELDDLNNNLYVKMQTASVSYIKTDAANSVQFSPVSVFAYNEDSNGNYSSMTDGIFYCLLPENTFVDPSSIIGFIARNRWETNDISLYYEPYYTFAMDKGLYDVSFTEDYEGTGRTMMKIQYTAPDTDIYGSTVCGAQFMFLLGNTYKNIMQNGTNIKMTTAHVNMSPVRIPFSYVSSDNVPEGYESIDESYDGYVGYNSVYTNYMPVDAVSWGFSKSVRTDAGTTSDGRITAGSSYDYLLTYAQSENAATTDLIFYDVLEQGAEGMPSSWHGIFDGLDLSGVISVSSASGSPCAPVVYYSTKDRGSFTESDFDIANSSIWSSEAPTNLSDVTAVAIDMRKTEDGSDFVLDSTDPVEVAIKMKAPDHVDSNRSPALNTGYAVSRQQNSQTPTMQTSVASVRLYNIDLTISKGSYPASGTEEEPVEVMKGRMINYEVAVVNTTGLAVSDIIVEDVLPDGMEPYIGEVMVRFGQTGLNVPIDRSPTVQMTADGQRLVFHVNDLPTGEWVYFTIPASVAVDEGVLENKATIVSANGVEQNEVSNSTWHKASKMHIDIVKLTEDGDVLPGAVLQLLSADEVVYEWTSGDEHIRFELDPGTYTLHEKEPPAGYELADDISIKVTNDGYAYVDGKLSDLAAMRDPLKYYDVPVAKFAEEYGKYLSGAILQILTSEENEIDQGVLSELQSDSIEIPDDEVVTYAFSSTSRLLYEFYTDGYADTAQLSFGDYMLRESEAPDGWSIAPNVQFRVEPDGSLKFLNRDGTAEATDLIYMIDNRALETVNVTKKTDGAGFDGHLFQFRMYLTLPEDMEAGDTVILQSSVGLGDMIMLASEGDEQEMPDNSVEFAWDDESECYIHDFQLADGEQFSVNVPMNSTYRIVEMEPDVLGYKTRYSVKYRANQGMLAQGNQGVLDLLKQAGQSMLAQANQRMIVHNPGQTGHIINLGGEGRETQWFTAGSNRTCVIDFLNQIDVYKMNVEKHVEGFAANITRSFTFRVELKPHKDDPSASVLYLYDDFFIIENTQDAESNIRDTNMSESEIRDTDMADEMISPGHKINRAGDDAGDLEISDKLERPDIVEFTKDPETGWYIHEFTLRDKSLFKDAFTVTVPVDCDMVITEVDSDGYTTGISASTDTGSWSGTGESFSSDYVDLITGSETKEMNVSFTNTKASMTMPNTGGTGADWIYIAAFAAFAAALFVTGLVIRRRENLK